MVNSHPVLENNGRGEGPATSAHTVAAGSEESLRASSRPVRHLLFHHGISVSSVRHRRLAGARRWHVEEMTLQRLIDLTRTHAGEHEEGALDGDVIDVLFGNLGYDSVALLEVMSQIRHQYGIDLADDTVGTARTPRQVLEKVNQVIRAK
jgi:minimal PKS acyl carrier protein